MRDSEFARVPEVLKQLRDHGPDVFGAAEHGFELNEPLSEEEVLAFEDAHSIRLPEDYRGFLMRLGNGGAGPFYGIFRLGEVDDNSGYRKWQEQDGMVGVLSRSFPLSEPWNDVSAMPDDDLADSDKEECWRPKSSFEETYWGSEIVNGAIPICHEGCAIRVWLVVTGAQAGKLWEDKRSEYGGLKPVLLTDGTPATFSSWFEEWLDLCLVKK